MTKRITFSGQNPVLPGIWAQHETTVRAVSEYFNGIKNGSITDKRFLTQTFAQLDRQQKDLLIELEHQTAMMLFSAIEARFQMDYLQRVNMKHKDELARKLRAIYTKIKGNRADLSDLLKLWRECYRDNRQLLSTLSDYQSALNYRHWLAHGRYWTPKFGRQYNAATVYRIVESLLRSAPFCA